VMVRRHASQVRIFVLRVARLVELSTVLAVRMAASQPIARMDN
jgi:hypothetical protein